MQLMTWVPSELGHGWLRESDAGTFSLYVFVNLLNI